jgi:hypothetical protein
MPDIGFAVRAWLVHDQTYDGPGLDRVLFTRAI